MQIRWIQAMKLWPIRSLQTKATLLVVAIVAVVLGLSTLLNIQDSQHALERDTRHAAIALARQFAVGIGSRAELNNPATLQVDIGQVMEGHASIARAIHYNSPRGKAPFVAVDCAALPESLLESELFGHEKGAFTGALALKKGLFEVAHAGTIFLDEVGDIGPSLQAKLLRVLQEHEVRRVGGVEPIKIDIRVIAATRQDLEALVKGGKFREDLFYRLSVVTITLPRLNERPEDIPLLAMHFLGKYAAEAGKSLSQIAPEAMALLCQYDWPGNVRELEHVIERAVALTANPILLADDLPAKL